MYLLINLFTSIFVHLFFLFFITKGLTGDWKLQPKEGIYLVLTGLLFSFIRVFVVQLDFPNLSAHLISDLNFFMITFIYLPLLFIYFYKIKLYSGKNAASFTFLVISIALVSDFMLDIAAMAFYPNLRLHWTMAITQHPLPIFLHLMLHGLLAFTLVVLFLKLTKNLRQTIGIDNRLQNTFLCYNIVILAVLMAALFVFYSREEAFFQEGWSWGVFSVFIALYVALAGSFLHTNYQKQKHEQQYKKAEYKNLKRYTDELEQQYTAMRKFKHDYQNIFASMDVFFDKKDWTGLEQYYVTQVRPASEIITKDNFVLEALSKIKVLEIKSILAAKIIMAQNMNIGIDTSFEAPDEINHVPIDSVSLVRMLGIILDNAIEELAALSSGMLSIACFKDDDHLTFIVQNTCRADIPKLHQLKQFGFSTKKQNSGLGLNILSEIEASYPNVALSTTIKANRFTQKLTINTE